MKHFLNAMVLIIFCKLTYSVATSQEYELEHLQVLFRHGDRIPDKSEVYKADPYVKYYKEQGFGQLTKVGLQREYKIGQMLRERYNDFLGEYKADEVYARSTDMDRTKMSLQMVLAGLYPPSNKTSWNSTILWSPIPTHYITKDLDPFWIPIPNECINFYSMLVEAQNSTEIQAKLQKYNDFIYYLHESTGINFKIVLSFSMLYSNLRAVTSMGLPLPEWCSTEDFKKIEDITSEIVFKALSYTLPMKRSFAGVMLDEFLRNLDNNEKHLNFKKIHLYSAHDINISSITRAHNFTGIPGIPDFGSTFIIEKLRGQDDGKSYIKMLLWTGVSKQLIPLKINDCGTPCLLSEYRKIIQPILADEKIKSCKLPLCVCSN